MHVPCCYIYALECFEMIVPSQSPKFMHETHDTGTTEFIKEQLRFRRRRFVTFSVSHIFR